MKTRYKEGTKIDKMVRYRFENFGGIISSQDPPFLAYVDRHYMRELGSGESPLWDTNDKSIGLLSAPTEVHFAITNRCSAKCRHCYMDADNPDDGELDTESFKRALDILAEMKVFHIALGGGEALERSDLFEIAEYARGKGLVPNLTLSGYKMTQDYAKRMKIFGQVNLSIDGLGENSSVFRDKDTFNIADRAIDMLAAAGVPTGINCVIGKRNFNGIKELFEYAKAKGLNEIEFLRFKPSGRGAKLYEEESTTHKQNIALTPMLAELSSLHDITAKIDCSFIPMLCYHNPPRKALEVMATYGCEAGNVLLGIRSNGSVSGCSFLKDTGDTVFDLPSGLYKKSFSHIFTWIKEAPEPCKSCEYLDICKGGCHAVSEYVTGDFNAPDPGCPSIVEYNKGKNLDE